jgi:hypothetical protein
MPYHTTTEWEWSGGGSIRMHRFLTGREADGVKPVFGLTACAYGTTPPQIFTLILGAY